MSSRAHGLEARTAENPYLPYPVRIDSVITETEDRNLKTFKLVFLRPEDGERFMHRAGQFAVISPKTFLPVRKSPTKRSEFSRFSALLLSDTFNPGTSTPCYQTVTRTMKVRMDIHGQAWRPGKQGFRSNQKELPDTLADSSVRKGCR